MNSNNIYSILGKLASLVPTAKEKHDATVKQIYESVEARGSILTGVDSIEAGLKQKFNESGLQYYTGKKKYGKDGMEALSKAGREGANQEELGRIKDKFIKKDKIDEKSVSQAQQKFMGMVHAAQQGEKAASPAVDKVAKSMGKKDAKDFASTKHKGLPAHVEETKTCNECGMNEGECEHTMSEAEITRTAGKTVHRKTDFPGYPADDADDIEGLRGPGTGKRGRPRKHAAKAPTGLGRGRPVKAKAPTFSKQADPFGRVSGVAPKGTKGTVHTMAEAMTQLELNLNQMQLTESRLLDDTGETLGHVLNRFRAEVRSFEQGGDLDQDLYEALFDYYLEAGEMPYGVAKARTGDPMEWVATNLESHLRGGGVVGGAQEEDPLLAREAGIPGNVPAEQIPGKEDLLKGKGRSYYEEDEVTMEDELNELARLAGVTTAEGNAFTGKLANTPKGGEFELDGKTFKDTSSLGETDLEEDDMEEGNEFSGELAKAKAQHKTEFEVDGKTYPVKEGMEMPGNDSSNFNISTNMSSTGDKNVTVSATGEHAATLLQMLRIAGLGSGQAAQELQAEPELSDKPELVVIGNNKEVMGEEGVEVDQPSQTLANAPSEKYGTIKQITSQGDDMNREKSQDPATANKAANPLTNAQNTLKAVAQLESKLAAEYESIKKVN
jgi:hypothetical protein